MRCQSCNCVLTDEEATRKSPVTKDYFDMCNECLGTIIDDIPDSIEEDDHLWDDVEHEIIDPDDLPDEPA